MFYTIYKITNNVNGKIYIGKHQTKNLDDGYMGSGTVLKRAKAKHGIENFTKEILFVFDNEKEMEDKEKELVWIGEDSYNLCDGGKGGFGYINREGLNNDISKYSSLGGIAKYEKMKNDFDLLSKHRILMKELSDKGIEARKLKYPNGTWYGNKHTKETKEKMKIAASQRTGEKNSAFGKCWITNEKENKMIPKNDLDTWIKLGYRKGRIVLETI